MKKSLSVLLVLVLSLIGMNALAAKLDFNVKRNIAETSDKTSGDNERTGGICGTKSSK
jgi:hypothetical protein